MARARIYGQVTTSHNGRPVNGASVTVRQPGTTTNITQTMYDKDGGVLTNPLTANAQGEYTAYTNQTLRVDLLISGTGITTETHYNEAFLIQDGGSFESDVFFSSGRPWVDPKAAEFGPGTDAQGAIADGTSRPLSLYFASLAAAQAVYSFATALTQERDWAAARKAQDALPPGSSVHSSGQLSGTCYLSDGRWVFESALKLRGGVCLKGAGRYSTVITNTSTTSNSIELFSETDGLLYYMARIEDMSIQGSTAATAGAAIDLDHSLGSANTSIVGASISNVYIRGHQDGVKAAKLINSRLSNVYAQLCTRYGFYTLTSTNATVFEACYAAECGSHGFYMIGNYCSYINCASDGNTGDGYHFYSNSSTDFNTGVSMVSSGAENNLGRQVYFNRGNATIVGGYFDAAAAVHAIEFEGGSVFTLIGPRIVGVGAAARSIRRTVHAVDGNTAVVSILGSVVMSGSGEVLASSHALQILSDSTSGEGAPRAYSYAPSTSGDAGLRGYRARGTEAAPTAVGTGDILAFLAAHGYGATGFSANRAALRFTAEEAWTDSAQGTRMKVFLTPTGSNAIQSALEITDNGRLFFKDGHSILHGTGSPEGIWTAPVGSLFLRTDGGAGTTLYVKQSGTGNTGWVGK